jgi:hypothetical protein
MPNLRMSGAVPLPPPFIPSWRGQGNCFSSYCLYEKIASGVKTLSSLSLLSKYRIVSRSTLKCNFIYTNKINRVTISSLAIFTKFTDVQMCCTKLHHIQKINVGIGGGFLIYLFSRLKYVFSTRRISTKRFISSIMFCGHLLCQILSRFDGKL